uniref:Uncharacterized protein n=1 Tax=Plectus sambesii TaxID=2011161 RepID=A0A914W4T9_9BILA
MCYIVGTFVRLSQTTYQGARSSTRAEPALTLDSSSEHEIIIDLCSGERSAAPSDWLEEGVTGGSKEEREILISRK